VLQHIAVRGSALLCVAMYCSALQCVVVRCSALQCVAVIEAAANRCLTCNPAQVRAKGTYTFSQEPYISAKKPYLFFQ